MMSAARYLLCFLLLFTCQTFFGQSGFVTLTDGTKISYSIKGNSGDTLVFLHGGPGQNSNGVGPDLLPLAQAHVLILYDQRGCGFSEQGDTNKITVSTHVEDLEELRKYFGINKMLLIGHSWGCLLAAFYTSKYPDHVNKLLLLSPAPPTRQLFQQRFSSFAKKDSAGQAQLAQLRRAMETTSDPVSICDQISAINEKFYYKDPKCITRKKGDYCTIPADAIIRQTITARRTLASLGNFNVIPLLQKIDQPALIIEGAQTPVPIEELNEWRKTLPGSRLLLIKKSGHAYTMVEQPKHFFKAVEKFLQGM